MDLRRGLRRTLTTDEHVATRDQVGRVVTGPGQLPTDQLGVESDPTGQMPWPLTQREVRAFEQWQRSLDLTPTLVALREKGTRELTLVCNSLGDPGATRGQILLQFLIESALLCAVGGFLGLLAERLEVAAGDILAWDVMAHDLTPSRRTGVGGVFDSTGAWQLRAGARLEWCGWRGRRAPAPA